MSYNVFFVFCPIFFVVVLNERIEGKGGGVGMYFLPEEDLRGPGDLLRRPEDLLRLLGDDDIIYNICIYIMMNVIKPTVIKPVVIKPIFVCKAECATCVDKKCYEF